jgi:lysophospholipase L1-like esterase
MSKNIPPHSVVLFQGDSITDVGRNREDVASQSPHSFGSGYAMIAASVLRADRPGDNIVCYNRGISGNRVVDLYARICGDVVNLKPTLLSVLIGVNDTWHHFNYNNGVPVPKYERIYRDFLNETREALPGIRFVLCEPFTLPCGVVTPDWTAEMAQRRAVVAKLAAEYKAVFVPFQKMFDEACREAPPEYWAKDGVHPSAAGHQRMARAWLAAVG